LLSPCHHHLYPSCHCSMPPSVWMTDGGVMVSGLSCISELLCQHSL
jgi:hypothetical protein